VAENVFAVTMSLLQLLGQLQFECWHPNEARSENSLSRFRPCCNLVFERRLCRRWCQLVVFLAMVVDEFLNRLCLFVELLRRFFRRLHSGPGNRLLDPEGGSAYKPLAHLSEIAWDRSCRERFG
jgi:hypothetical protein